MDNTSGSDVTITTGNAVTFAGGTHVFGGSGNLNMANSPVYSYGGNTFTLNSSGSATAVSLTFGAVTNYSPTAQTLTVNNAYSGAVDTLVLGGYNLASGNAPLNDIFTGSGNITINGPITGSNAAGEGAIASDLTYTGTGTLTMAAANTYSGMTVVEYGGAVNLDFSQATSPTSNIISSSSNLSLVGSSLSAIAGSAASTAYSQTFASATLGQGGSTISASTAGGAGSSMVVNLGMLNRVINGATVNFALPSGVQNATNGITTTATNNVSGILGGWATVGGDWATVNAGGNIVAYSGYTPFVAQGGSSSVNYAESGSASLAISENMNSLQITDTGAGQSLNLGANNLTFSGNQGGLLYAGGTSGSFTINGTGYIGGGLNGGVYQEFIATVTSGATLDINAPLIGFDSGGSFTKGGAGTLVVGGESTYTNGTYVAAGTLQLGTSSSPLGSGTVYVMGSSVLDLNGQTLNNTINLYSNGPMINGQGAGGIINSNSTTTATLYGTLVSSYSLTTIGGAGNIIAEGALQNQIIKVGAGTLTLAGPTDNGNLTLTVNGGTVVLAKSGGAGEYQAIGGNGMVINNGLVQFSATSNSGNEIYDSAPTTINPQGTLDYNGQSETQGLITLQGGQLINSSAGTTSVVSLGFNTNNGAWGVTLNATSTVGGDGNLTIVSPIIDAPTNSGVSQGFGLTKVGAGIFTSLSPNTYTGATTINGGVFSTAQILPGGIASGIGQSLNLAQFLVLNGGTLQYTGSGTTTDRLFTLGPGGGGLDSSGVGAIAWNGNSVTTGTAAGNAIAFSGSNTSPTLTFTGSYTGSANTFAPIIGDNGSGATGVAMTGAGTWLVTGANTYSGATTVSSGVLQAGVATNASATSGAFGVNSAVTVGMTTSAATLDLNGLNESIGSLAGNANGAVSLGVGTLTVGGIPSASTVFSGVITGSGGLTVTGGGWPWPPRLPIPIPTPGRPPSAAARCLSMGIMEQAECRSPMYTPSPVAEPSAARGASIWRARWAAGPIRA